MRIFFFILIALTLVQISTSKRTKLTTRTTEMIDKTSKKSRKTTTTTTTTQIPTTTDEYCHIFNNF
jgi:hypothetical protein